MRKVNFESFFHSTNGSSANNFGMKEMIAGVAGTDVTCLIQGESGVGKGVLANEIHRRSARSAQRLLKVNCAAMPDALLEAELFGYEKGAFTGADCRKVGKFEAAQGGTLLLDEIADLPFTLQAKLLHVLQDGVFTPLGSTQDHVADVRILASSNRNLEELVGRGLFRNDLFYRLNVVAVHVPPLRERREEIIPLAQQFLTQFIQEYGRPLIKLTQHTLNACMKYPWPGNIRELENTIKRIVIWNNQQMVIQELLTRQGQAQQLRLPEGWQSSSPVVAVAEIGLKEIGKRAAREAERQAIQQVLYQTSWNRSKAAQILKISYKALLYKMQDCGLDPQGTEPEDRGPVSAVVFPLKHA